MAARAEEGGGGGRPLKDLAPSAELRRWFGHDPARWDEFRERYARELEGQPALLDELRALARHGRVTLLFGAHDEMHNNAAALRETLLGRSDPNSAAAGTNPGNAPNIKRPTSVR